MATPNRETAGGPGEHVAVFDLDGTLIDGTLFEAPIFAEDELGGGGAVDWVSREVIQELSHGGYDWNGHAVEYAVRIFLRDNANRRTPQEVLELSLRGGHWPNNRLFTFTPLLAWAWQQVHGQGSLHAITHSPQFLAERLLREDGIQIDEQRIVHFDFVNGSTYETDETSRFNGQAYANLDKAETYRQMHGAEARPELVVTDSFADLALISLARYVAVNPDPFLETDARKKGMPIVWENRTTGLVIIKRPEGIKIFEDASELRVMQPDEIIQLVH